MQRGDLFGRADSQDAPERYHAEVKGERGDSQFRQGKDLFEGDSGG